MSLSPAALLLPLPAGEAENDPVAGLGWLSLIPRNEQGRWAEAEAGDGEALYPKWPTRWPGAAP